MSPAATPPDVDTLSRLNRLSLTRTFTPQTDVDWTAVTTEAEYEALYSTWSLLAGTGVDGALDATGRANYVKYQHMNLMAFTGLLERHGIRVLALMYDLDDSQPFREYLGNFLKEEVYHYTMFDRAVRHIHAGMAGLPPLPTRGLERTLTWLFGLISCLPGRKLRANLTFTFFRFAEQVTICIHQMVQSKAPRCGGFVNQVWAFHALDEARHLAFDDLMLERSRLRWPVSEFARSVSLLACALLAFHVNANEVWAARQLGLSVRWGHLPGLLRRTKAPFKHRVFGLLRAVWRGGGPGPEGGRS
jgi:hypothetical protein